MVPVMSVLHKEEIQRLLSKPVEDPCSLRITPLLDKDDQVKADAVDIRRGSYFLVPRTEKTSSFVPGITPGEDVAHRLHVHRESTGNPSCFIPTFCPRHSVE